MHSGDGHGLKMRPDGSISAERSRLMASVRQKNTEPELAVRQVLHRNGYRYRLHRKSLPGSPDLVLPSKKLAIFVHGCFWHRHRKCKRSTTPKSRQDFWAEKFRQNVARDRRNYAALRKLGWSVKIIWECQTKDEIVLERHLFLALGKRHG